MPGVVACGCIVGLFPRLFSCVFSALKLSVVGYFTRGLNLWFGVLNWDFM